MIKINDLRIGNYIQFGILNIVKVESIKPKTLIAKAKDSVSGKDEIWDMVSFSGNTASGASRIEVFEPIPLTEEILLKCGFKYVEYFNSFGTKEYGYKLGILTIRQSLEKTKYLYDYNNDLYVELKSLHQLQNIYFFLMGQELEINL